MGLQARTRIKSATVGRSGILFVKDVPDATVYRNTLNRIPYERDVGNGIGRNGLEGVGKVIALDLRRKIAGVYLQPQVVY